MRFRCAMTGPAPQDAAEARHEVLKAYEAEISRPKLDLLALLDVQEALLSSLVVKSRLNERRVDSAAAVASLPFVQKAIARVRGEVLEDVDMAIFLKAAAELQMMAGAYEDALSLLADSRRLFADGADPTEDCADELKACENMVSICRRRCAKPLTAQKEIEEPHHQVSVSPANAPIRLMNADDTPALIKLFGKLGEECSLSFLGARSLQRVLTKGCCWAAQAADASFVGAAVATTDGTFGYLRELVVDPSLPADLAATLKASLKLRAVEGLRRRGVTEVLGFSTEMPTVSQGCFVYKLQRTHQELRPSPISCK